MRGAHMSLLNSCKYSTNKNNAEIIVVDLPSISSSDKDYIAKNLVEISKGKSSLYSAGTIANKLSEFLKNQSADTKKGAVAEFYITCIIRNHNYEQNHCYRNLEEGSVKKGFDGLFLFDNDVWLMESKSTNTYSVHNYKHKTTINKAYVAINDMLSGKTTNDPWENAESHARITASNKANNNLIKKLTQLSANYTNKQFVTISSQNLILGSTIFADNISQIENNIASIQTYLVNHQSKSELVICLNVEDADVVFFEKVLEEIKDEQQ